MRHPPTVARFSAILAGFAGAAIAKKCISAAIAFLGALHSF
jgi:hypothetical protein